MKTRLYIALFLAALTVITSHAQTAEEEATVKAIRPCIGKYAAWEMDAFIERDIMPKFKKSPYVMVGISRHFEDANDSLMAFKYANKALAIDGKYVPAYVMKGTIYRDWARTHEDSLEAFKWFDKAIEADPKNPEGYLGYMKLLAKTDPDAAVEKLKTILAHVPDYPVYIEAAHIYDEERDMEKVVECYGKADMAQMPKGDFLLYATYLRVAKYYDKADSVLIMALAKFPTDEQLNRLALRNSFNLKNYDAALERAEMLFKSDSVTIEQNDYIYYAQAYEGKKRYKDAIAKYQAAIDFVCNRSDFKTEEVYENALKQVPKLKCEAMEAIAKDYNEMGFSDKAIEMQLALIDYRKEQGAPEAGDALQLAKYYIAQAEVEMGEAQIEAYKKAYDAYGMIAEIMPERASLAYYYKINIAGQNIEGGKPNGFAEADALAMMELIPITADMSNTDRNRLEYAIQYMIFYCVNIDDYVRLAKYCKMMGQVNPENSVYLKLMGTPFYRKKMRI
ncbi:MAG: hypothetical protein ACI4TW_02205 [Prevotella sp.]